CWRAQDSQSQNQLSGEKEEPHESIDSIQNENFTYNKSDEPLVLVARFCSNHPRMFCAFAASASGLSRRRGIVQPHTVRKERQSKGPAPTPPHRKGPASSSPECRRRGLLST